MLNEQCEPSALDSALSSTSSPSTANTSPITGSSPTPNNKNNNTINYHNCSSTDQLDLNLNLKTHNISSHSSAHTSRDTIMQALVDPSGGGGMLEPAALKSEYNATTIMAADHGAATNNNMYVAGATRSESSQAANNNGITTGFNHGADANASANTGTAILDETKAAQPSNNDAHNNGGLNNDANSHSNGHASNSHESASSSNSGSTCTTSSDASPNNDDSMLFTKRAISKNNSMTSVFSSFHSASSATSKLHKHKHKHHGPSGGGDQLNNNNNNDIEHREDASPDDQILGTSCDCPTDKPSVHHLNNHVNNRSRIQAPATSQMPIKEEIGTIYPFKEGSPDTITTDNISSSKHTNNNNTKLSNSMAATAAVNMASDTTTTTNKSTAPTTLQAFNSRKSPPRKYQPATVVLPSQKVQQLKYHKAEVEANNSMGLMSRDDSYQRLDKFPFMGLAPNDPSANNNSKLAITSLPSSFSSKKGHGAAFDETTAMISTTTSSTIPSTASRTSSTATEVVEQDTIASRRTSSDDGSYITIMGVDGGMVSPPPKQIRELKTPMYVPAVLRRTAPSFSSEMLPSLVSDSQSRSSRSSRTSLSDFSSPLQRSVSYQTIFSTRTPTKIHWRPDNSADSCHDCHRPFTFFERRHHCRKCGDLFCAGDSSYIVYLDQQADFDPRGCPSRACHSCFTNYQEFRKVQVAQESLKAAIDSGEGSVLTQGANKIQTISGDQAAPVHNKGQVPPPTPGATANLVKTKATDSIAIASTTTADATTGVPSLSRNETIVGSVPADWSWSTF